MDQLLYIKIDESVSMTQFEMEDFISLHFKKRGQTSPCFFLFGPKVHISAQCIKWDTGFMEEIIFQICKLIHEHNIDQLVFVSEGTLKEPISESETVDSQVSCIEFMDKYGHRKVVLLYLDREHRQIVGRKEVENAGSDMLKEIFKYKID